MEKFKSGVFGTIMVVSMSVGILASIILLLLDDVFVLPFLAIMILGALANALISGIAFLPAALKIRQITRALEAINSGKRIDKIDCLPFGFLGQLIEQTNTLLESQVDFQSMRGKLYEQISEVAAQEERNRLARDLHDSIKQQVFSMSVSAAAAHVHLDTNPQAASQALQDVRQSAQEAMVEMRVLLQQLAPAPLEQSGLIESMRHQMEALSYRTGATIETDFDKLPSDEQLPIGAQETLFRIAQEALSNIARHARAKKVALSLKRASEKTLVLSIADNGQGFDLAAVKRGMGLNNMERRVEDLNGELDYQTAPNKGTILNITVPLEQKDPIVDLKLQREKNKKIAESVYHQYIGVACTLAGLIFSVTVALRAIFNGSSILLTIVMAILAILTCFGIAYFWRNYQEKWQSMRNTVPDCDPAYKIVLQHRSECHWIICFAIGFVVPGSFIGIENFLWLPSILGLITMLAIVGTMLNIIRNQHAYMKLLLPSEMEDAMRAFRLTLTSGVLATVFVVLTVILPGTSKGLFLMPMTTDEWDSNFFTGMIVVFVFYHLMLMGLYWHWNAILKENTKELS